MLGGITRLTGSGLSITEWDVVTGTLPPFSHQQWLEEFAKYQQTPQFRYLNHAFSLADFKSIFFWEWFHRLWARLMGFVFLVPFVFFLLSRRFSRQMMRRLLVLFLLGGLQGAIGWVMVASGLTGDAVYVKPMKLAIHFLFAMLLLSVTFWFSLQLLFPGRNGRSFRKMRNGIAVLLFFILLQFFYGALMAGHKAAVAAATWPSINGYFFPDALYADADVFNNPLWIHFIHRMLGYLVATGVLLLAIKGHHAGKQTMARRVWWLPLLLVALQVALGVASVISSTGISANQWVLFNWLAAAHQLVAMLLLLSLLGIYYLRGIPLPAPREIGSKGRFSKMYTNLSTIN